MSGASTGPSAFEEHQTNSDPMKTRFITEEATSDLSSVAAPAALDDVMSPYAFSEGGPARPASDLDSSESLANLLPEDQDLFPLEEAVDQEMEKAPTSVIPPQSALAEGVRRAANRPAKRRGVGAFFGTLLSGIFLVVCLCAPVYLVAVFAPLPAEARSAATGPHGESQAVVLHERLAEIGGRGVKILLGKSGSRAD